MYGLQERSRSRSRSRSPRRINTRSGSLASIESIIRNVNKKRLPICYDFIELENRELENDEICIAGDIFTKPALDYILENNIIDCPHRDRLVRVSTSRGHYYIIARQLIFISSSWNLFVGKSFDIINTNIRCGNTPIHTLAEANTLPLI